MAPRTEDRPASSAAQPVLDRDATAPDPDGNDCRQCVAGDADACTRLFRRHEAEVARQVGRFSRDRHVREELVQEVFVEVYLALPRYRPGPAPLSHWLARITTRVGYRFWKRQARRPRHLPLGDSDLPEGTVDGTDPAAAAALLHALLARLAPADRLVLTLRYFEDCSIRQIATRTGWNGAMVKMRALRARRKLKALIEKGKLLDQLRGCTDGNP